VATLPSWIAWVWRICGPLAALLGAYAHVWTGVALYGGLAIALELWYRRSRRRARGGG
jgi:hypothetical protein